MPARSSYRNFGAIRMLGNLCLREKCLHAGTAGRVYNVLFSLIVCNLRTTYIWADVEHEAMHLYVVDKYFC